MVVVNREPPSGLEARTGWSHGSRADRDGTRHVGD